MAAPSSVQPLPTTYCWHVQTSWGTTLRCHVTSSAYQTTSSWTVLCKANRQSSPSYMICGRSVCFKLWVATAIPSCTMWKSLPTWAQGGHSACPTCSSPPHFRILNQLQLLHMHGRLHVKKLSRWNKLVLFLLTYEDVDALFGHVSNWVKWHAWCHHCFWFLSLTLPP